MTLLTSRNGAVENFSTAPFVFWDGYGLDHKGSGIFVHAYNLAKNLGELGLSPYLIADYKTLNNFPGLPGICLNDPPIFKKLLNSKLIWPLRVYQTAEGFSKKNGLKTPVILHGLSNLNLPTTVKKNSYIKTIITVHDLIPYFCPQQVSKAYWLQLKLALPRVLDLADKVVCVSEWTRNSLLGYFKNIEPQKVVVIPNGIDRGPDDVSPVLRGDGKIRLLTVSRHETYKRLNLILDLLNASPETWIFSLVTDTRGYQYFEEKGKVWIDRGRLALYQNLPRDEVSRLYANHDIYLSPSLYEGFSLPAAEALCLGLIIVYQGGSGIDEVVGEQVGIKLMENQRIEDWLNAIEKAFEFRQSTEFSEKLNAHIGLMSCWKDAARQLKNLYNEVYLESPR